MRLIKQTFALLMLVVCISSCASILGTSRNELMSVQKGMSKNEVSSILGQPDYRRFDNQMEEWEYSKPIAGNSGYTTIIVCFVDNRVVSMDSFQDGIASNPPVSVIPPSRVEIGVSSPPSHPQGYKRTMDERDFQVFYNKVKSKPFKDDQLELIKVGVYNNRFSCKQCIQMMSIYMFDDDKLNVLEIFASKIVDRENYDRIIDALDFISSHEKAKKMLRIK